MWRRAFLEVRDATTCELRIQTADGRFIWVAVTLRRPPRWEDDSDGSRTISGVMFDISGQAAARRENSELWLAINAAMDGIARTSSEGVYTHLNRAHLTMFGYEREEELLGKTWRELYEPDEVARIETEVFPILIAKGWWSGSARALRRGGIIFPEDLSLTLLPDGGIICICRDATERVQALHAWKQSEARWQLAAASIQEGLWDFDVSAGMLHLSPRWMEILELAESELTLSSAALLERFVHRVHPDDFPCFSQAVASLLGGASDRFDLEVRIRPEKGPHRWLQIRGRALVGTGTVVTRIVGSVADIESRKAQAQLEARNFARERELVELKSHFVAMASHELRTPVATLSLSVELLQKQGIRIGEEKFQNTLGHMRGAANQLREIVGNLLILGESDEGRLTCVPVPVQLDALLHELVREVSQAKEFCDRIEVVCKSPMHEVGLDPRLVRSIVLNLLTNACKYSPPVSPVILRGAVHPGQLVIDVIDQGIGIPQEEQSRLFSHFFRASNAADEEGSGLGLVIVKRCCDAHGASVHCHSALGRGTAFTIVFPQSQ